MSFNHQIWNINFSGIHGWGEHQILKVDSGANKEPPNRCHVWTTYSGACIVAAKLERRQDVAILEHCCCQVGATEEPRGCNFGALLLPSWSDWGTKRLHCLSTVPTKLEKLRSQEAAKLDYCCCHVGARGEAALLEQCCMLPSWSEGAGSLETNWNGGAKLQWMLRQASALCQPSWSQVTRRCYLEPKL